MLRSLTLGALAAAGTAAFANPVVTGPARFTVITPECVRMEYQADGAFIDASSLFAVNRGARADSATVEHQSDGTVVIKTDRLTLTYTPNGQPFSDQNLSVEIEAGDRLVTWTPASRQTENLGGTIHTLDQVKGPVDLEEGILSRDGWYLIDDSENHLLVDGWAEVRPEDAGTDWYLFAYGSDYKAAFEAFTAIGGKVPMPRKAVLGSWYSRWWEYTTEDYKEIVREYEENDFPLDIMVMDMEWHTGPWTGWSWNYELLPDPVALLDWFHEQGLTVTLNVHPADGVRPEETMYEDFMRAMGEDPASGETITYDAGNREYMETFFKYTHHPREDEGVDFWWLDWQQYPETISIPGLLNLSWLNYLYFENSKRGGKRGLQFSRWGSWGDHRHPIHFSGDADTGWRMLGFEVPFTSVAGNEGTFFWSHDIGGHFGDRNEEPYTRWVQFASVTAAMRLHSGIIPYLDRRPWKWPDWATESMRHSFHLRSRMMPYVYSSVWQCYRDSLPLTRPMYLQWPEEADAYMAPQEYLFGEAILTAPIASAGFGPGRVASQLVWFPEGEWVNYFTSERFTGPEWRLVSADMNEFPLYVRAGVPIPEQPYSARPTTARLETLVVKLWPGVEGETHRFTLYEDDGDSQAYEQGGYATTELSSRLEDGVLTVEVGGAQGSFEGQVADRDYRFEIGGLQRPRSVKVEGRDVAFDWSEESGLLAIEVPARPVSEGVTLAIEAETMDPSYFANRALDRRLRGIVGEDGPADLSAAISRAASANDPALEGLLALAGFGFVENETHYPEVGVLERLVRNDDAMVAPDGIEVAYERRLLPSGEVLKSQRSTVTDLQGVLAADAPEWKSQSPEFMQTVADVRSVTARVGGETVTFQKTLAASYGTLNEWVVSPAYPFDRASSITEFVHAPEKMTVEELATISPGADWTRATAGENGIVDLRAIHDSEDRIAYAVSTFDLEQGRPAQLGFRSDDGIEVWLNGEKIHSASVLRGINHPWEDVPVTLKTGRNVLLVKVSQADFGWEFVVRGMEADKSEQ